MNKITGVKSVDFLISATGEGVVNHNGAFKVYNPAAGQAVENHMFPKLRGMDPMQRLILDETGKRGTFSLSSPELSNAKLIVSSECIRSHLFKSDSFGIAQVTMKNVKEVLASIHGLIRGFLNTENGRNFARKTALYTTDFECEKPGLYFDQHTNSKVRGTNKEDTSIYSYFGTDSNLKYSGKASISIEDLQFIALENSLGRTSYDHTVSIAEGQEIASKITEFLQDISDPTFKPEAQFVKKAIRVGSISGVGDAGVLLNNDAIHVLVLACYERIQGLSFKQGKGWLGVTDVVVDFNSSSRTFRACQDTTLIENHISDKVAPQYAQYYTVVDMADTEFEENQFSQKSGVANKSVKKSAK